jgi:hypothetical protein
LAIGGAIVRGRRKASAALLLEELLARSNRRST